MTEQQQAAALAFLTDPAIHGVAAAAITIIETHISIVVLAGDRAYKLKRALRLPYVDFSTPALRYTTCEAELRLNRRTAPQLYRAVRRITRESDGRLVFDGMGPMVDAVVEMQRFDETTLFDRLAQNGGLTAPRLTALAKVIAAFHEAAPIDPSRSGSAHVADVLDVNERALATTRLFRPAAVERFNAAFRAGLARHEALLDARGRAGKVRHCHGDLHLRNICLVDGVPTLFDCLEFDAALATVDILYDLAFLLMDLWHRGLAGAANLVFNRTFDARDDADGLSLLPFFMALRAAVRAHVGATAAESAGSGRRDGLAAEAQAYFALAETLLAPRPARLVAIGGFSGSGKSTIAARIADAIGPPPGARLLASDRLRKQRFGVAPETRLPEAAYRPEISEAVYRRLYDDAAAALAAGHGVLADAVFDRADARDKIAEVAARAAVPFAGVWLVVPPAILVARVEARRHDPSDATPAVVEAQLAQARDTIDWIIVEAASDPDTIAATVARRLGLDRQQQDQR